MLPEPLLALALAAVGHPHADRPLPPDLPLPVRPSVRVVLHLDAGVPPLQLERAVAEATRLLAAAGVDATWDFSPAGHPDGTLVAASLDLRIASCGDLRVPACTAGVLGRAISDGRPGGFRRGVVYADRVNALVRPVLGSRGVVMGRVLAHEIVHLLAGPGAHEDEGVMRAAWDARRLEDPLDAASAFSDALRARLRRALAPTFAAR